MKRFISIFLVLCLLTVGLTGCSTSSKEKEILAEIESLRKECESLKAEIDKMTGNQEEILDGVAVTYKNPIKQGTAEYNITDYSIEKGEGYEYHLTVTYVKIAETEKNWGSPNIYVNCYDASGRYLDKIYQNNEYSVESSKPMTEEEIEELYNKEYGVGTEYTMTLTITIPTLAKIEII